MFDIAVLGGGPAGAVVAKTLSGYGYHVAIVAQERRFPAIEGLSERALQGLRYAGCSKALQRIGPRALRQAHWNGDRFAGNQEWIVERGTFDAGFLIEARGRSAPHQAGVLQRDPTTTAHSIPVD